MKPCSPEARTGLGKWFGVPQRQEQFDYSYDGLVRSFEFSLERLGISRIKIFICIRFMRFYSWIKTGFGCANRQFFDEKGYAAMLELRDQGGIKAIGGGVNEWEVCQNLADRGDFDFFLPAGGYTLLEPEALESFLPLCELHGIGIVTGGPYHSVILATGAVLGAYYNYDSAPAHIVEKFAKIQVICAQFNTPIFAAALQFPLLHSTHVAVIPGGQSAEQTRSNIAALECYIPSELWTNLKSAGLLHPDAPTGSPR